jgi:hypothetical protein
MKIRSLAPRRLLTLLLLCSWPLLGVRADDPLPPNIGRGLRPLVEWQQTQPVPKSDADRSAAMSKHLGKNIERVETDETGRVTVDIRLDGTVPPADLKKSLTGKGLTIIGEHVAARPDGLDGVLSAHLPLEQAAAVARTRGVFSVLVAHRPRTRIGNVTSQGVGVLHADQVQDAGYLGKGIEVGVLSDSYNVATAQSVAYAEGVPRDQESQYAPSTTAAQDAASGDLPGVGNPNGYNKPVYVIQDGGNNPTQGNTDEGRAMLQILHDMAPAADLAFCTAGETESQFATNIESLRTNPNVYADIIVDDIGFDDEPFFSDGIISQAVDDVVTSTTLAGRPVLYYSAAGNDGDVSYSATFTPVSDAAVRSGQVPMSNLQLDQVPEKLTAGGFHNFQGAATGEGVKIVQKVIVSGDDVYFNFQWDDPFIPGKVSTDYNVLVFDKYGNFLNGSNSPPSDGFSSDDLPASGDDNNFTTGEAVEFPYLALHADGSDTTFQIVITQAATHGPAATHLRYIVEGDGVIEGQYLQTGVATLFGHSGAQNADGVAAYDVHDLSTAESYESFGPVTIYFDDSGNRLTTPITREQPTMAAVDGVDTTFFPEGPLEGDYGTDSDNDGFPNFYGTSAAAPHAAGVAALLLQAAGGKGSLNAAAMRSLLQSTAGIHDLDPAMATATFRSADGLFNVSLVAQGDASDNSSVSTRFFTLSYTGPAGSSLLRTAINIGPSGLDFDQSSDEGSLTSGVGGFPFTIGLAKDVQTSGITSTVSNNSNGKVNARLDVFATPGSFPSGGLLSFGIDRDERSTHNGGNDADLLAGSTVIVHFLRPNGQSDMASGTFVNKIGKGYSPDVGFGLINAEAALQSLQGK